MTREETKLMVDVAFWILYSQPEEDIDYYAGGYTENGIAYDEYGRRLDK